jgi:hypothetical protein
VNKVADKSSSLGRMAGEVGGSSHSPTDRLPNFVHCMLSRCLSCQDAAMLMSRFASTIGPKAKKRSEEQTFGHHLN